jgi:aerobic carbon-monoxide dehydrogenase medium subunit
MSTIQAPKSVADLIKVVAKHGKRCHFVSGVDPTADRIPAGKVVVDLGGVNAINEIDVAKDKVVIGTGLNLGRVTRDVGGENGLLRQASSIIANPLVRNRVTFLQALDPESPYFDITTPLVLLESKVRLQSPTGKRMISIRDYLDLASEGLTKSEIPVQVEFARLAGDARVGFFRVVRMSGNGTVSAAARMKLVRNVCKDPEIVVSSLSLIPLRSKLAEKELHGQPASEDGIKRAATIAANEILEMGDSKNSYERSLIEITVARTLRTIMEGSIAS